MERMPDGEVRIVIEVRPRAHNPIHKPVLHQRHDAGTAQARWSECACETHSHNNLRLKHLLGEEVTPLTQTRGIVGLEI